MIAKLVTRYRFGLALAVVFALQLVVIGVFFSIIALDLEQQQSALLDQIVGQRGVPLAALAVLLLFGLGIGLNALFNAYLAPLAGMAEDAVTLAANPGHRTIPRGAREVRLLAEQLNNLAAAYEALERDVQAKIESANRALAEEKNRLAALMSELAPGVLVCNTEGRILLYNLRARQLLETEDAGWAAIGLGRSVFGAIERGHIVHALEQIQHQLLEQHGEAADRALPVSGFIASLADGRMVRVRMAPVLDGRHALDGFVLTLEDITHDLEADSSRDALIQSLTEDSRAALANVRAALEAMQTFPNMSDSKRGQFIAIIDAESQRLADRIESALRQHSGAMESRWQLEEMRGADLVGLLLRRVASPMLRTISNSIDETLWLKVDSYALTQAVANLAQRLCRELGVAELRFGLQRAGRLAQLDLAWTGAGLATDTLRAWESEPISAAGTVLTLNAVLARHGGAAVYRAEPRAGSRYRLLLPLAQPQARFELPLRRQERPEFYDFDLFHQPGQSAELDQCLLSQLSYTVFDTETTGLQPAAGDEIISIGALRIVNGRLLQHERFDQLVQPRHVLSVESINIHGITDAMLGGQPRIEKVLPRFHQFAADTVLIAHNAAFDMRFLQMQQTVAGVAFTQPVLDTLLLSQVIHPHQSQHTLEAIAARLGVTIIGRHTALGDAIVTAEVFLKMIPLLAQKDILTLKDAREAAEQSLYARIRY